MKELGSLEDEELLEEEEEDPVTASVDVLELLLFFDTTTPTTTPIAIRAARPTIEPMTYVNISYRESTMQVRTYNPFGPFTTRGRFV